MRSIFFFWVCLLAMAFSSLNAIDNQKGAIDGAVPLIETKDQGEKSAPKDDRPLGNSDDIFAIPPMPGNDDANKQDKLDQPLEDEQKKPLNTKGANPSFPLKGSVAEYENQRGSKIRASIEEEREERQIRRSLEKEHEDQDYNDILVHLIDTYKQLMTAPRGGCWINQDCTQMYVQPLDDEMRTAHRAGQSMNGIYKRLSQLKQIILSHIQNTKIPFATYVLSVISKDTIARLQNGDRIPLLNDDQLKRLLPGDLDGIALEMLLFENAENFENNARNKGTQAIKDFLSSQERWISQLPKGYDKQPLNDLLNKMRDIFGDRDYFTIIFAALLKDLPQEMQPIIPGESNHDAILKQWNQFRENMKGAQKTYDDSPLKDDRLQQREASSLKEIYQQIYRLDEKNRRCDVRVNCINYITSHVREFFSKLPDFHSLRKNSNDWIQNLIKYVKSNDSFDFSRAFYNKMSAALQSEFKSKRYPSADRLSDDDIFKAMSRKDKNKRPTVDQVRVMLAQYAARIENTHDWRRLDYDGRVERFKSTMEKFLERIDRFAIKVDKSYAKSFDSLWDLVSDIAAEANRQNPKRIILEYIYNAIPQAYRTRFDEKQEKFIESGEANSSGQLSYLPHEKSNSDKDFEDTKRYVTGRSVDVTVFSSDSEQNSMKNSNNKEKKDDKKKPTEKIASKISEKAEKVLGGFLNKIFGGLFG